MGQGENGVWPGGKGSGAEREGGNKESHGQLMNPHFFIQDIKILFLVCYHVLKTAIQVAGIILGYGIGN